MNSPIGPTARERRKRWEAAYADALVVRDDALAAGARALSDFETIRRTRAYDDPTAQPAIEVALARLRVTRDALAAANWSLTTTIGRRRRL